MRISCFRSLSTILQQLPPVNCCWLLTLHTTACVHCNAVSGANGRTLMIAVVREILRACRALAQTVLPLQSELSLGCSMRVADMVESVTAHPGLRFAELHASRPTQHAGSWRDHARSLASAAPRYDMAGDLVMHGPALLTCRGGADTLQTHASRCAPRAQHGCASVCINARLVNTPGATGQPVKGCMRLQSNAGMAWHRHQQRGGCAGTADGPKLTTQAS